MSGALPRGACDCHCHVFGPAARFPYAEPRSYTPDDAPLEAYLALLDRLGFDRGVLVQPSAYGRDNRAMLDALTREPQRLRGVAVGGGELDAATLKQWHAAGVRGLRANEFRRDGKPYYQNGVSLKDIEPLLPLHRRSRLASAIVDRRPRSARHGCRRSRACRCRWWSITWAAWSISTARTIPASRRLLRGVGEGRLWAKLSGTYRLGATPPDYARGAAVPRRAGRRQSAQSGVGHRLAASAAGGPGAGRRAPAASVSRLDAGRGQPAGDPRSTIRRGCTIFRAPDDVIVSASDRAISLGAACAAARGT